MSETSAPEERTELPTDRRMGMLRKQGSIFTSNEVTTAISFLVGYYSISYLWPYFLNSFKMVFRSVFTAIGNPEPITVQWAYHGFVSILTVFGPLILIFTILVSGTSSLSVMLQTRWNIKEKWIKFDWASLNPINGIKKIFSIQGFINTGKAIVKLALILPIAYFALKAEAPKMIGLLHTSLHRVFEFAGQEIGVLFWKIMYVLIGIAVFDYFWGNFQWMKSNKMTKDEVKDERKATEGDETTRRKIISKAMQRLQSRLMSTVPKAHVVVTNPTHFAVALRYDRKSMKAPTVVAKGSDFMAQRIREIAKEAGVPIVERKTLARALFASVEVGHEIPYELYRAVAEVLAYVFKLKNPWAKNSGEARA